MAYEKNYDRRAAKSRGDTDMDVDALAAEKAEQQDRHAELEAADNRDYGEDVDYTDAEWVEYEKGLQDELNWLGARGKQGKGKGKSDRRKGKGKGKDVKGKGYGGGQW